MLRSWCVNINSNCVPLFTDPFKARHILNTKESWSVQDGAFNAKSFYENIVALFKDRQWADDTLKWWNE
jgi:hypothetical protein